jgi:hypothetical protein
MSVCSFGSTNSGGAVLSLPKIPSATNDPSRPDGLDPMNAHADNDGAVERFVLQEVIECSA